MYLVEYGKNKKIIQEEKIISTQNLNEYLETLHLAPAQFCDLPGFYLKKGFLTSYPLSLHIIQYDGDTFLCPK